jgi:ATP synthase protein I
MADDNLSSRARGKGSGGGGGNSPSPASFAGAGIQFVLSILIFLYLGKWLDAKLGTAPWLLMAGVFLGAGASFYSFYRRVMAASRRDGQK